jgi:hypothetical protein
MTYSRVTYLVEWDADEFEHGCYLKSEEFMTLHQALDFAQPKLLMGEEVLITPMKNL